MTKRILVRAYNSTFVVTVPAKAKLTMGPDLPYTPRNRNKYMVDTNGVTTTYAFRAYDGTKLIMYLPRAQWFRDLDATSIERIELKDPWRITDEEGLKSIMDGLNTANKKGFAALLRSSDDEAKEPEVGMV